MMRAQPRRRRSPSYRAMPATPEARRYPPEGTSQPASARKPPDRTSKSAVPTIDPTRRRHGCSGPHRPPPSQSPHEYERCILPTDAKDKEPCAPRSYGHCLVVLYNEERPHSGIGNKAPGRADRPVSGTRPALTATAWKKASSLVKDGEQFSRKPSQDNRGSKKMDRSLRPRRPLRRDFNRMIVYAGLRITAPTRGAFFGSSRKSLKGVVKVHRRPEPVRAKLRRDTARCTSIYSNSNCCVSTQVHARACCHVTFTCIFIVVH